MGMPVMSPASRTRCEAVCGGMAWQTGRNVACSPLADKQREETRESEIDTVALFAGILRIGGGPPIFSVVHLHCCHGSLRILSGGVVFYVCDRPGSRVF